MKVLVKKKKYIYIYTSKLENNTSVPFPRVSFTCSPQTPPPEQCRQARGSQSKNSCFSLRFSPSHFFSLLQHGLSRVAAPLGMAICMAWSGCLVWCQVEPSPPLLPPSAAPPTLLLLFLALFVLCLHLVLSAPSLICGCHTGSAGIVWNQLCWAWSSSSQSSQRPPPWHLHPVQIPRKYLNQTLPLGLFFRTWLLWCFCTCKEVWRSQDSQPSSLHQEHAFWGANLGITPRCCALDHFSAGSEYPIQVPLQAQSIQSWYPWPKASSGTVLEWGWAGLSSCRLKQDTGRAWAWTQS